MASRSLGTLTLDLVAKIGGFEQGMDRAARTADRRMREIERRASAFGKVLGGAIATGAGVATAALISLTKNAIDYADHLNDLNQRLGISAEALSGWAYAAQQTGTDIDALGRGLKILSKNMAEALDPKSQQSSLFKALGVDVKDAKGNLRSLEEVLPDIASKFKELDNATTEAALAQQLFGKSGTDLLEFLNQGEDGLEAMRLRARELGVELNDSTLKAADEFNDKLADLKSLALGAGLQLAAELLPALTKIVDQLQAGIKDGGGFGEVIGWIGDQAAAAASDIRLLASDFATFGDLFKSVGDQAQATFGILKNIATLDFSGAKRSLLELLGARERTMEALTRDRFMFSNVSGGFGTTEVPEAAKAGGNQALQDAINRMLGGSGSSKKAKAGKSDAEKEAEALAKAYENTNERLKEQIALFGKDGEAAALRYELEFGALAKLDPLKKAELIQRAENLDMMRDEAEVAKEIQKEHDDRVKQAAEVLQSIDEERKSLGMSYDQWELYNNVRRAGVNASKETVDAIKASTEALQEERKALEPQIAIMDDFRAGLEDTVSDVIAGNQSISDAFKDLFDDLSAQITRWIARRLIEQAFGAPGTTGQGSSSGWVSGFLGMLFGGGRAAGGQVLPGQMYRVNENWNRGPELLSMGGRDYLMMGSQAGKVSAAAGASAGLAVTQNFYNPQMNDPRSESQRQQQAAQNLRTASVRNA